MSLSRFFLCPIACALALAFSGCALQTTSSLEHQTGAVIGGSVHGGQQPISGAHLYLFAANTTGYGQPSVSLLNAAVTLHSDSLGAYVVSGADGGFSISGDYTCTPNTQVYLYALGGNPGAGNNPAAGLMAALGNCPGATFSPSLSVNVNELTTVAAAYAMAGFATDVTHVSSSGTALAATGIANAFANAGNLVSLGGSAYSTTPAGNGVVPQAEILTLGNILASCINSTGSLNGPANPSSCYTLFHNALSGGSAGTLPTDTATAAINIAHNPTTNVGTLFNLSTPSSPFPVTGYYQPNDFSIAVLYKGGGLAAPNAIAIDAAGNAWVANNSFNVTELSPAGVALSGATGYPVPGRTYGYGIAIDTFSNVWVTNQSSLVKLSSTGAVLSGTNGFTGGGLNSPAGVALDGLGNVWVANVGNNSVSAFNNLGIALSGTNGYTAGGLYQPYGIAFDSFNNAWTANYFYICSTTKFSDNGTALSGRYGFNTQSGVVDPRAIAIDNQGRAWIANENADSVTVLAPDGSYVSQGYTGGNLNGPFGIALDGAGTAWVANAAYNYYSGVTHLSSSGAILSGQYGYGGGNLNTSSGLDEAYGIAVDGSGGVWVANNGGNSVMQFVGAATPVVTPLAAGVANGTLATAP